MFNELTIHIQKQFQSDFSGHDFDHVRRVIKLSLEINKYYQQNEEAVYLTALLHDVFDEKFFDGDVVQGCTKLLRQFNIDIPSNLISDLENIGFKGNFEKKSLSLIGQIVEDADRLDAIGAIGIARMFAYGGAHGRVLYDSSIPYRPIENKQAYRQSQRPSYFHFYDKLLLLKDLMHTEVAREMAQTRHTFMEAFIEQFKKDVSD